MTLKENSIAYEIVKCINDYAENTNQKDLLDELTLYVTSHVDNSAVVTVNWYGPKDSHKLATELSQFIGKVRDMIAKLGKEAVEQVAPEITTFGSYKDGFCPRIEYRFRIWSQDGTYEKFYRQLEAR